MPFKRSIYPFQVRVLVGREKDCVTAHALEMDLLGSGSTEKQAIEDLKRAIESQVSFAFQNGDPSLIQFRVPQDYFERWDDLQKLAWRGMVLEDKSVKLEGAAMLISFTESEMQSLREGGTRFKRELKCAKS